MSTFSPNLRIELIGTGEQAGTWGNTTNTNLGTVLEDAITGYVTVSVIAAQQPLTVNDGVADQARNAMLELTTTTGAAFEVFLPPNVTKQYTVFNNSGYAATVYNSTTLGDTTAAGTGVVIPNNKTVFVTTDGTDVVHSINYIGALQSTGFTGPLTGNVTGNADTATALGTTNYTVEESGGYLYVKYGATNIARFDSAGNLEVAGEVTAGVTL